MKKAVASAVISILCLGLVLITLLFHPYAYIITNPSHAELVTPAIIDAETWIDGEKIDFQWSIQLVLPKAFFGGVENIALIGKNNSTEITLILPLNPLPPNFKSMLLRDSKDLAHFSTQEEQMLKTSLLKIISFSEKMRRMKLEGTFEVAPTVLTLEKHPWDDRTLEPIQLEIRNGRMQVDSTVIYEWSSKGGDTYRL